MIRVLLISSDTKGTEGSANLIAIEKSRYGRTARTGTTYAGTWALGSRYGCGGMVGEPVVEGHIPKKKDSKVTGERT